MLVLDAMGDHIVEAYSSMGLVMALYVQSIVSLCLPHLVDERTLRMGSVLDALDAVLSMCLLYVSLGSRVRPSILGCVFMSSVLLLICRFSFVLYSAGSGVKRVHVVFSVLRMRLFACVHTWMLFKYGCRCVFAVCKFLCVVEMVMSSAYVMSCVCLGGGGMSEVYMLKNVCERTPPCGTPVLNWRWVDVSKCCVCFM